MVHLEALAIRHEAVLGHRPGLVVVVALDDVLAVHPEGQPVVRKGADGAVRVHVQDGAAQALDLLHQLVEVDVLQLQGHVVDGRLALLGPGLVLAQEVVVELFPDLELLDEAGLGLEEVVVDDVGVRADGQGLVVDLGGGLEEADHAVDLELLVAVLEGVGGVDEVVEVVAGHAEGAVDHVGDLAPQDELLLEEVAHHGVRVPAVAADREVEVAADVVDAGLAVGHVLLEGHGLVHDRE